MTSPLIQRPQKDYRGRFAPSPSGFLHFGSLIAALASFVHAKSQQGSWLIRIEDIDPPREQAGASACILSTLDAFGLHWDESVLYQSQQSTLYSEVLQYLADEGLSYACQCSRAQVKAIGGVYQGQCQPLNLSSENNAVRLVNVAAINHFQDLIQGPVQCNKRLAQEDFIIRRKDGLFAYQLAVVVDDIYQGISHVIRGCDLLEPTARQLSFFKVLSSQAPVYGHVPLAVTPLGYKLSKQNKAPAIDIKRPQPALITALKFLGQQPPAQLISYPVDQILDWAITHWCLDKVPKKSEIML